MYITTLLFAFNDKNELLLAMKKRGFGAGKWNGPGGKADPGETPEETCKRETNEEVGIVVNTAQHCGTLDFHFHPVPGKDPFNRCEVFITRDFTGEPQETEEMKPQWFALDAIPYKNMWEGDDVWLPAVLKGEKISYTLSFDENFGLTKIEPRTSEDV